MKCPLCGEDLILVIAQNADVIIRVNPQTMTITGATLSVFDNVDIETYCCRSEDIPDELYDAVTAINYSIDGDGQGIDVTQH